MERIDFVQGGLITPAGTELLEWLDKQCDAFDENPVTGSISGYVGHYYTMAYKPAGKSARLPQQKRAGYGVTEAEWLKQYPESARNAHRDKLFLEEKAVKEAEQTEQVSDVEEQLKALQEEMKKEITQLKRRNTILEKKVNAESEDEPEPEDEPESEDEPED